MKILYRVSGALFVLFSIGAAHLQAAPIYRVTDLGTLPSGVNSLAFAMNDNGQVVGMGDTGGQDHAFLYSGGSETDLGTLGGTFSQAQGINNSGVIVGYSSPDATSSYAFRDSNNTMANIGALPGQIGSVAFAINNSGQIVGYSGPSNNPEAFLYNNGTMTGLGALGGTTSAAYAINGIGHIAGGAATALNAPYHAFLYSNGTMTDIGTLHGWNTSVGYGINSSDEIVGFSQDYPSGLNHAFLYSNGTMTDLGSFGLGYSDAYGINDNGWIVGRADTTSSFSNNSRAFLDISGTMYDLNNLLDTSGAGWTLLTAEAINSSGQIVGTGYVPAGEHAFLLTPVPEPSSIALALVGFLGIALATRRSR